MAVNLSKPERVSTQTIEHYRQNKVKHILTDLEALGVSRLAGAKVLLARGVFKWFAVRRSLIKRKEQWKKSETILYGCLRSAKRERDYYHIAWFRGYIAALQACRADIRHLCKSSRWQAQDNDTEAQRLLREIYEGREDDDSLGVN